MSDTRPAGGSALAAALASRPRRPTPSADAKAYIEAATASRNPPWDGPDHRPEGRRPARPSSTSSTDQRNGGARGVGDGVKEAAETIGWTFRLLDGQGTVAGALERPRARRSRSQPDVHRPRRHRRHRAGAAIEEAAKQGITIVGWHSYAKPGPHDTRRSSPTSPPIRSTWRAPRPPTPCAETDGKAGVVDLHRLDLRDRHRQGRTPWPTSIKACADSKVLEIVDTPLADASNRMPPAHHVAAASATATSGPTRSAINDLYFDFMAPSLAVGRHRRAAATRRQHLGRRRREVGLPAHPRRASTRPARSPSRSTCRAGRSSTSSTAPSPEKRQRLRRAGAPLHARPTSTFDGGAEEHLRPRQRLPRRLPEDLGRRPVGSSTDSGGRANPPAAPDCRRRPCQAIRSRGTSHGRPRTCPSPTTPTTCALIGHSDQGGRPDGVQLMVNKGHAFIGHMFSNGFSVIDVRDPREPEAGRLRTPAPHNTWNIHLPDLRRPAARHQRQGHVRRSRVPGRARTTTRARSARRSARSAEAERAGPRLDRRHGRLRHLEPRRAPPDRLHAGRRRRHPPHLVHRRPLGLRLGAARRLHRLHLHDHRHGRPDQPAARPAATGCPA